MEVVVVCAFGAYFGVVSTFVAVVGVGARFAGPAGFVAADVSEVQVDVSFGVEATVFDAALVCFQVVVVGALGAVVWEPKSVAGFASCTMLIKSK